MSSARARPPWGKLMPNWLEGTPAFCVWIVYAPVIFHCEFSWCSFAGAHGSVSEGVMIEILGVFLFRILFLGVTDACLIFNLP